MNDWTVSTRFSKKWRLASSFVSFIVGYTSHLFASNLHRNPRIIKNSFFSIY